MVISSLSLIVSTLRNIHNPKCPLSGVHSNRVAPQHGVYLDLVRLNKLGEINKTGLPGLFAACYATNVLETNVTYKGYTPTYTVLWS